MGELDGETACSRAMDLATRVDDGAPRVGVFPDDKPMARHLFSAPEDWMRGRTGLAVLLVLWMVSNAHASSPAQVSLYSGDRVAGQFANGAFHFSVKSQTQQFRPDELEEWRLYQLALKDGTLLTRALLADPVPVLVTTRGPLKLQSSEIAAISFRPVLPGAANTSATSNLLDSHKESIKMISGITLQFVLIAVGLFSLAGTYLARTPGDVIRPLQGLLVAGALVLLAVSVIAGYFVHGSIIGQLEAQRFSAYNSTVQFMGAVQLGLFLIGAVALGAVVWSSAIRRGVLLRLAAPHARRVTVVGSFNNWGHVADLARYRLHRWPWRRNWSLRMILPAGTHEYLFLIEGPAGQSWEADPHCLVRRPNPYGGENSVITVI